MNPIASIYSALTGDAGLLTLIDTHGAAPAIFSGSIPPAGYVVGAAVKPCILIGPIADDFDADDFSTKQRFIDVRVRIYARAGASDAGINAVAWRVRNLLHRKMLPASGGVRPRGPVTGPAASSTSAPEVAGRQMTVRLFVTEG